MNPINNISSPMTLRGPTPGAPGAAKPTSSFKDVLLNSIHEVNSMQQDADQAVQKMACGEPISPAEVLTAVQKADIAFRLMIQVRNKIVQAYEEVANLRV